MNAREFKPLADMLIRHFGSQEFGEQRMQLIFERAKNIDEKWFRKIVNNVIIANRRNFDFDAAIRDEINYRIAVKLTEDTAVSASWARSEISDDGLNHHLQKIGAKSLFDAITRKLNKPND